MKVTVSADVSRELLRALAHRNGRAGAASAADVRAYLSARVANSLDGLTRGFRQSRSELGILCPDCGTETMHRAKDTGAGNRLYSCVAPGCGHIWKGHRGEPESEAAPVRARRKKAASK